MPVFRQRALVELGDFVDITGQGQGYHVSAQAIDHTAGLFARTAVGLLDFDVVARVAGFPETGEFSVVILVQLAGWIVGNVQQLVIFGHSGASKNGTGQRGQSVTA